MKDGKFKGKMSINFPIVDFPISSNINVMVKNHTNMYINGEKDEECKQNVEMEIPSFIVIKSPKIPQCSDNINIESKILGKQYLHLAYVKNNSYISAFNKNVKFSFHPIYYAIKFKEKFIPKLSEFNNNVPQNALACFIYYDNKITLEHLRKVSSIVKLSYEHNKLKNIAFNFGDDTHNYNENGIIYEKDDKHQNKLDILIDQIQEEQNIDFHLSKKFVIPWTNIIKLFDKTKEKIYNELMNEISNDFKLKDEETYYVLVENNNLSPIQKIPDHVLSNKRIKSNSKRIFEIKAEKYDHLGTINCENIFEILENLDSIKLGLQLYKQIYDYKTEIALNIFNIYQVIKSLGENEIMLNTFHEIIEIGNKLFDNNATFNVIEVLNDKYKYAKCSKSINFKKNKLDRFIFNSVNSSVYGNIHDEPRDDYNNIPCKMIEFKPISLEQIYKTDFKNIYEMPDEPQILPDMTKSTDHTKMKKEEIIYDEKDDTEDSDLEVGQIEAESEKDESKYPGIAYKKSTYKKSDVYSILNVEKQNKNNFLPEDAVLADGEIVNLDKYVFNVIGLIIQSNFHMSIPNDHITLLIDISQLSGSNNKNTLAVNMMVAMHVLSSFEISFSVWMFADRNLCFCVKKPDEVFDKKRQCLIRDAYFLKRINQVSYVLSAIDTVTKLELDQKSNLFVIFSTFVSSQTLRPYDEWKQIVFNCTRNKHVICLMEPYQYKNPNIDLALNENIKDSDFIHIIKYTNICETIKNLMLKIFILSKNFSKGSQSLIVDTLNIPFHKFSNTVEFKDLDYHYYKNTIDIKKIKSRNFDFKQLNSTKIIGNFEIFDTSILKDFGDVNHIGSIMIPNKPTKYELSTHGYNIDIKGLINSYLSKFSNLKIFKQKTGDKIREYCVDIIIDCSNIIKLYSIDHCFISVLSLLFSLKDLNIPFVNLVIVGKHIIPLLVNQDLKFIYNNDPVYSTLYSLLIEEATQSRILEEGIRQVLIHSLDNSIPHIMFVVTDALLGQEHEEKIKEILSIAQLNGEKIIGIGTGPMPYRIEKIFTLSAYAKNPYQLREVLYHLMQSNITKQKSFSYIEDLGYPPIIQSGTNTNDELLKQFSEVPFLNDFLFTSANKESFDRNEYKDDYFKKNIYDWGADGEFEGYNVLVLLFYERLPNTIDRFVTKNTFIGVSKSSGPP